MMARAGIEHMRRNAALQDEGRFAILILTVIAAAASLGAILSELSTAQGATRTGMQLALATITIVLSWTFVHTIFALHYAHEYYGERGGKHDGLNFPGEETGLLGLRLFLLHHRHDVAGLRRRDRVEADPPHRDRARHPLVLFQRKHWWR